MDSNIFKDIEKLARLKSKNKKITDVIVDYRYLYQDGKQCWQFSAHGPFVNDKNQTEFESIFVFTFSSDFENAVTLTKSNLILQIKDQIRKDRDIAFKAHEESMKNLKNLEIEVDKFLVPISDVSVSLVTSSEPEKLDSTPVLESDVING